MSFKVAIRLGLLILSLLTTLFAIALLKRGHMDAFWTSLGFSNAPRLNWCEERVSRLHLFESSQVLFEEDQKWKWRRGEEVFTLDYLRVEKWFAKYCQVDFEELESPITREAFLPVFEAQFLVGEPLTLYSNNNGVFRVRDRFFRSETLRQGLKELLAFAPKIE